MVSQQRPSDEHNQIWGHRSGHSSATTVFSKKDFRINVAGSPLHLVANVKSLGVYVDSDVAMDARVNAVCHSCNYQIQTFWQIRPDHSVDLAKTVSCCIVGSRQDYCNSLKYRICKNLQKLQRVQNNLSRMTLTVPRRSSTELLLKSLHWLPVVQLMMNKSVMLIYNANANSVNHKTTSCTYPIYCSAEHLFVQHGQRTWSYSPFQTFVYSLHRVRSILLHLPYWTHFRSNLG